MKILRSYGKPLTTIAVMLQSLGFSVSLIAQIYNTPQKTAPGYYQWCKLSKLNPDKGFTAVQVPLLGNTCIGGSCLATYVGNVARYNNIYTNIIGYEEGEQALVFSDNQGVGEWCGYSNSGCFPPEDYNELEVLCDTPEVIHKLKSFESASELPYFTTLASNIIFPDSHLCTTTVKTTDGIESIMGVSWSGDYHTARPDQPSPDEYCPAVVTFPAGGLVVDHLGDFVALEAPQTYMIAESRELARSIAPECVTAVPWREASSKLAPLVSVSSSEVLTNYPQEQVTLCQAFTSGAGKKLAGTEFPDITYTFDLGGNQSNENKLTGGCKLIDRQLDRLVSQSVATTPSGTGYQRISLSTSSEDWIAATEFDDSYRAGCVTYENSINSYNFCRFARDENSDTQIYGYLIKGTRDCSGVAITFNDESSMFEYSTITSPVFEIYTGEKVAAANSGSRMTGASPAIGVSAFSLILLVGMGLL